LARKILLADDSVTAQNMGRKILADAGYEVIAVNNGSAALKKMAEVKPDLVVLDVYMPGYSGLEVCQRLKESPDSARIPVLLTVGKLEPFKPEEAQRVRAEGFIVKPFEASELLSALSKLEDKVVPRPEPSKPGRFARAIAAVEASAKKRDEAPQENGWKSRIGYPSHKTEPEAKPADDADIYNPVNRDLRTVVETAAERVERKAHEQEPPQPPPVSVPENGVDVAAVAPAGLPQDVTPEEVAAIAAAAAQIQMTEATIKAEASAPELPVIQPPSSEATGAETLVTGTAVTFDAAPVLAPQPLETHRIELQDNEPVTMAATAEAVPVAGGGRVRWSAVAVGLEGDEAAVSLEEEMHMALVASSAAPGASETKQAQAETPAESPAAHVAEAVAAITTPSSSTAIPEPEPATAAGVAAKAEEFIPVAQSEPAAVASFSATQQAAPEAASEAARHENAAQQAATQEASIAPEPAVVSSAQMEAAITEPSLAEPAVANEHSYAPSQTTSAETTSTQTASGEAMASAGDTESQPSPRRRPNPRSILRP